MKTLLACFEYLKRYHSDILEALGIMLELLVLKKEHDDIVKDLIAKANKRKPIKDSLNITLRELFKEHFIEININANATKILKMLESTSTELSDIESFLHIISQKKTTNKLYYHSTPKEVNTLLVLLLDIKDHEEVYNPCYGMGSIFLSIGLTNPLVKLYGEELDDRLFCIANLTARFCNIGFRRLVINDILKQVVFKDNNAPRKFDKVICNPPLYSHMGIEQLKEDERFTKMGILVKNYPELLFLTHGLSHLRHRGVFIVRNQTLQKSFLEEKFRQKLVEERMLEAIIELPKNIFPNRSSDFSILVISHSNDNILHINASNSHFYVKDGKYNKIINVDEIHDIFKNKKEGDFSKITPIEHIDIHDLRPSKYLSRMQNGEGLLLLRDIGIEIFRGQRVYGSRNDTEINYYDVGIVDFATCGFSDSFSQQRNKGDFGKISKYKLKPYDILLSLRGLVPKIAILDKVLEHMTCIANAGILILRAPSINEAIGIYCYFFSKNGFESLCKIYEKNGERAVSSDEILDLQIPYDYLEKSTTKMQEIEELKKEFALLDEKLQQLRQS